MTAPARSVRSRPGLLIHGDRLPADEVTAVDGVLVTTAERTAYDLGRRLPLIQSVCAIDALAHRARFDPAAIHDLAARHPGVHGLSRLANAVGLADRRAESPRESLCRLVLVLRGLPAPTLQHPVYAGSDFVARLDLAYPDALVGIEYDGAGHRDPLTFTADLRKHNALAELGWVILRFTSDDLIRRPDAIAAQVAALLEKRCPRARRP